jgi:hypothetical protein
MYWDMGNGDKYINLELGESTGKQSLLHYNLLRGTSRSREGRKLCIVAMNHVVDASVQKLCQLHTNKL